MVTEYSLGFLHNDTSVVLIRKNRPEWQAGSLNGVGGHVEQGESFHSAQVREFYEETGVFVPNWEHFLTLSGKSSMIECFAAYDTGGWISKVKTMTDEEIKVCNFGAVAGVRTVPNLEWILPLMRQRGNYKPITINFHGE